MIELYAYAPDGWALARVADTHWLLRPPYTAPFPQTSRQIARALADEDFELVQESFDGWGEHFRRLEQRRVEAATPEEQEAAREAPRRILRRASAEQASRHLDRIAEAIEDGRAARATDALHLLLEAGAVVAEPALVQRIARLLQRAKTVR